MQDTGAQAPAEALDEDDARLAHLGYRPQLNRVLGLFANFSVAFTYLSPMVGIFSLFVLGLGTGGPAYIWLTWIPVAGMLLVALVFGELASHYPVAGAPEARDVPLTGGRDRIAVRGNVKRCPAASRVSGRFAAPSCGCLTPDPSHSGNQPVSCQSLRSHVPLDTAA